MPLPTPHEAPPVATEADRAYVAEQLPRVVAVLAAREGREVVIDFPGSSFAARELLAVEGRASKWHVYSDGATGLRFVQP